jgi:hypothetical protein
MDDLDRLLRVTGGEAPLEDLEARVWRRVGILERTREGVTMRGLAVAVALSVGLINGGVGASLAQEPPSEMAVFGMGAASPLTRLEGR